MKTGVIVYMTGNEPEDFCPEKHTLSGQLGVKADQLAWISGRSGYHDVYDADFALSAKGMSRIICVMGEFSESGAVNLTGRSLRLRG